MVSHVSILFIIVEDVAVDAIVVRRCVTLISDLVVSCPLQEIDVYIAGLLGQFPLAYVFA